ncbi:MAG TPA: hypothetical protein VGH85_16570 [Mycobacteriales bacterium]
MTAARSEQVAPSRSSRQPVASPPHLRVGERVLVHRANRGLDLPVKIEPSKRWKSTDDYVVETVVVERVQSRVDPHHPSRRIYTVHTKLGPVQTAATARFRIATGPEEKYPTAGAWLTPVDALPLPDGCDAEQRRYGGETAVVNICSWLLRHAAHSLADADPAAREIAEHRADVLIDVLDGLTGEPDVSTEWADAVNALAMDLRDQPDLG